MKTIFSATLITVSLLNTFPSNAQMTPDLTLPNSTTIRLEGNTRVIEGGTQVGSNLFHSFGNFSIPNGISVKFNNNLGIENIITRITGSSISNIDGLISANGTANLFLINPNGIVFGANTRLDIGGSFLATTAESLQFANGSEYSSKDPKPPLLTVDIPVGLKFNNPGDIIVQGTGQGLTSPNAGIFPTLPNINSNGISVREGETIALLGGKITLEGSNFRSQEGRFELSSIDTGLVRLTPIIRGWTFTYDDVSKFNDINITEQSLVNVSGSPGGNIQIYGANINLVDGSVLLNQNQGENSSGSINIKAFNSLVLEKTSSDGNISSSILTEALNNGKGGDINISARNLSLQDGARIGASTYNNGLSGNINVNASGSIQLLENRFANPFRRGDIISFISSGTFSSGNAGSVDISSDKLRITDGGTIASSTLGVGNGNNITVNSNIIEILGINQRSAPSTIAASVFNSGNGGNLLINTWKLKLENGGVVSATSIASGNAGEVSINAKDFVEVSGRATNGQPSFIASSVNAPNEIQRQIFRLPTVPTGSGSSLTINTKVLDIHDGGLVSVGNQGTGNAGEVIINATKVQVTNGSGIIATTNIGQGGDIKISTRNTQLKDGNISATAGQQGSTGDGGNINIDSRTLVLLGTSNITANAFEGRGGNILIDSRGFFLSPNSKITASSERGVNGSVQINTTQSDFVKSDILTSTFTPTTIENACSDPSNSTINLSVLGKGGTPQAPSDLVADIVGWIDQTLSTDSKELDQSTHPNPIEFKSQDVSTNEVAQGWKDNGDGTVDFTISPDSTQDLNADSSSLNSSCVHSKATDS